MKINSPQIINGPLTAADLDRKTNQGTIYHPRRTFPAGLDQQGRRETRTWAGSEQPIAAEAGTDLGSEPDHRAIRRFWSLYLAAMLVAAIAGAASLAGCTAIPRLPF